MKFTFEMPDISFNTRAFDALEIDQIIERDLSALRFAITSNLESAMDQTGAPLAPLSVSYGQKKEASGRVAQRDLNYTGDFYRSMKTRAVATGPMNRSADIYFLGSTRGDKPITFAQLAEIQNQRSPWFFISKPFQDSFVANVRAFIDRSMRALVKP